MTPNSSLQDRSQWSCIGYNGAATILDAILNYTFLPHIWNVYPSFFQSPMGPLQGSKVKIRGHMIAHRTPLSPRTIPQIHGLVYWSYVDFSKHSFKVGLVTTCTLHQETLRNYHLWKIYMGTNQ